MIKGLIFDLDGVLVDTAKYHYKAWKDLAASLGFDFTEKDNEKLKGVSRMTSLDILLETGNITDIADNKKVKLAHTKNTQYVGYIDKMQPDEILPGALEFLEAARKDGYKIALGSASKNAERIINRLKIKQYFDAIIDGTKVAKAKPDPEVFLKGAEEMDLSPDECIVFEDAQAGIEAAKNGSFKAVGIGQADVLKQADLVLPNLKGQTPKTIIQHL